MKLAESEIVEFVPTNEGWVSDSLRDKAIGFYGRQGSHDQSCLTMSCPTLTKEERKLLRRRLAAIWARRRPGASDSDG